MAKFDLRANQDNLFKERLTESECRQIAAAAIRHGLIHLPIPIPPDSPRIRPPAGKRKDGSDYRRITVNYSKSAGVPSDVPHPQ